MCALRILVVCFALLAPATVQAAMIFVQDFESSLSTNESVFGNFSRNNTGFSNNGTMMMGHAGPYNNNEYSFYQINNLNFAGVTNIQMSFEYRGNIEMISDGFNVQASTGTINPPSDLISPTATSTMQYINGATHPQLGSMFYDSTPESGGQSGIATFDLSSFSGSIVNIRFQFGSDSNGTNDGFNMDNLVISGDAAVPEPGSLVLGSIAALGIAIAARRQRRQRRASAASARQ